MEETKQVIIQDIQDIIEASRKIKSEIELIKYGYTHTPDTAINSTHTPDTGINRLDVIKSYERLIRSIANRMLKH